MKGSIAVIVSVAALLVLLTVPVWAVEPDTTWTGAGDGWRYLDPDNWDNGLPRRAEDGYTPATTHCYIMNDDTVTIDDVGALAGRGRKKRLYVGYSARAGYPAGNGVIHLVPGGEITGVVWLGNDGHTGKVVQTGGNWLQRGDDGISYGDSRLVIGASGYGRYELKGGNLGGVPGSDMSNNMWGLGRLSIGLNAEGEFVQEAGTYVQCRGSYFVKLAGNSGGKGTYTMNGGTLRANGFYWSLYGGNDPSMYARWDINSTDVNIVLGSQREGAYASNRCTGIQLGYNTGENAVRCYWSAVEGLPGQTGADGQTVQIEIVGGQFKIRMRGAGGRDADVAGLNNITVKFTKNPIPGDPSSSISTLEVAGKDIGAEVAGLCNNFALEGLIVGGEAGGDDATYLDLTDDWDNMVDGDDNEALYVNVLKVNADSELWLNGHNLYYYKSDGIDGDVYQDGGQLIQIPWIPGDADWDVKVQDSDLNLLLSNWSTGTEWGQGDFNDNDTVDDSDLNLLLSNWGDPCELPASAGSSVPEPATMSLLGFGLVGILLRRRRK